MEDVLKEILYELKEIREDIRADGAPTEIKIAIGDDVLAEKVIRSINKQSRMSGDSVIVV